MTDSMWEKINMIRKVYSHNQTTESPIIVPPTVEVVVVNQQQQQQLQQQQQQQQQQSAQRNNNNNNNNNNNFGFPNMGYSSPSPMMNMYNNNYAVIAAAQSILNAAAAYNTVYSQPFTPQPPQLHHPASIPYNMLPFIPPSPSPMMQQQHQYRRFRQSTPMSIHQYHNHNQQQQHHQQHHQQQQQQQQQIPQSPPTPSISSPNFVKRKPVRLDRQQSTMSPQIQQRLFRRKSAPAVVEKKKVRFKDEPTVHYIESDSGEFEGEDSDDDYDRSWKNENSSSGNSRIGKYGHLPSYDDWENARSTYR